LDPEVLRGVLNRYFADGAGARGAPDP
jgi:hypothetical protein